MSLILEFGIRAYKNLYSFRKFLELKELCFNIIYNYHVYLYLKL